MTVEFPAHEIAAVFGPFESEPLEVESIYEPIVGATVGVWRVRAGSRTAVLKLLAYRDGGHPNWQAGAAESDWMYWRREANAYESGMLADLPDGLRAPDCYHVTERSDGSVALWLEDLQGHRGADWHVSNYGPAARHFGRWQGRDLLAGPLRSDPWLSHDWLRTYLTQRDVDDEVLADDHVWQRSVLAQWFTARDVTRLRTMRADRNRFLDVIAGLPPVVSHLDLHPNNLFLDANGATAVIDWAYVGLGCVGEDVGNLVPDSVLDFHIPVDQIGALDTQITDSYNTGLADAGASIDPADARLGMTATMAAKYAWIGPALARAVIDERDHVNGQPAGDATRTWAPAVLYVLDRADEARHLIDN